MWLVWKRHEFSGQIIDHIRLKTKAILDYFWHSIENWSNWIVLSWHSSRFSRSNDEWLGAQIILGVLPVLTLIEGIDCWGLPSTSYAPSLFPSLKKCLFWKYITDGQWRRDLGRLKIALHKETFDYVREKKNINTNRLGWEKITEVKLLSHIRAE